MGRSQLVKSDSEETESDTTSISGLQNSDSEESIDWGKAIRKPITRSSTRAVVSTDSIANRIKQSRTPRIKPVTRSSTRADVSTDSITQPIKQSRTPRIKKRAAPMPAATPGHPRQQRRDRKFRRGYWMTDNDILYVMSALLGSTSIFAPTAYDLQANALQGKVNLMTNSRNRRRGELCECTN